MKKYLLTGLGLITPIALTLFVIGFLFKVLTTPFVILVEPSIRKFSLHPGLVLFITRIGALLFLCIFILLLGCFARWFIGKHLISFTHKILHRIPFVRSVYKVSRDVISALFSTEGKKAFKRPVLIPFPMEPNYSIAFEAGEVAKECQENADTPLVSIFMPTAPHPISGFFFLVPKDKVYPMKMSNEEAFKYLVSCGLLNPEHEVKKHNESL